MNAPDSETLPQCAIAEEALLGCLLSDPDVAPLVVALLADDDWYREAHRTVWQAVCSLHADKVPVSLYTVAGRLESTGKLDAAGGLLYLGNLAAQCITTAGANFYSAEMRRATQLRKAIKAGRTLSDAAGKALPEEALPLLQKAEAHLRGLVTGASEANGPQHSGAMLQAAFTRLQSLNDPVLSSDALRMPWKVLDAVVKPLLPQQVVIVGARPSMGKTALAINMAYAWAHQGHPGLIVSAEMGAADIGWRALLSHTTQEVAHTAGEMELGSEVPKVARDAAMKGIGEQVRDLWNLPVYVDDRSSMSVADIAASVERLSRHTPLRWLVVDYLQLLKPDGSTKNRARSEEVGRIAYDLLGVAKTYHLTLICLTQLSRSVEAETPRRPQLHHLYESGMVEAAGQLVLTLYWPARYGPTECATAGYPDPEMDCNAGYLEVGVLKQRGGVGTAKKTLWFDGARQLFRDLTYGEAERLHATKSAPQATGRAKPRSNT